MNIEEPSTEVQPPCGRAERLERLKSLDAYLLESSHVNLEPPTDEALEYIASREALAKLKRLISPTERRELRRQFREAFPDFPWFRVILVCVIEVLRRDRVNENPAVLLRKPRPSEAWLFLHMLSLEMVREKDAEGFIQFSAAEIQRGFGINTGTVAKALQGLERAGLIEIRESRQGAGRRRRRFRVRYPSRLTTT